MGFKEISEELDGMFKDAARSIRDGVSRLGGDGDSRESSEAALPSRLQGENFVLEIERETKGHVFVRRRFDITSLGEGGGFKLRIYMRDEGRRGRPVEIEGFAGSTGELSLTLSYGDGPRWRKRTYRTPGARAKKDAAPK